MSDTKTSCTDATVDAKAADDIGYKVVKMPYSDVSDNGEIWKSLRTIYTASFPGEVSFRKSVPGNDQVYIAYGKADVPSGFLMVHPEPPYRFTKVDSEDQPYMFNLAVDVSQRKKGVASALLKAVQADYKCLTCHLMTAGPHHKWFGERGWQRVDTWRGGKYTEYVHLDKKLDVVPEEPVIVKNYDPDEGLIYVS